MLKLLGAFFSGLFLFNAAPHLVRGICGRSHMTPFSVKSSPLTNVLWAWVNIIIGLVIVVVSYPEKLSLWWWAAFLAGGLIISLYLSVFWSNPDARLPWHKD